MCARPVGPGFSPLDELWHLGASPYPEQVQTWMLQVGCQAPFGQASQLLKALTGLAIHESTIQRWTEAIGTEALQVQDDANAALHYTLPAPTHQPAQLATSADGAMVPLVHGVYGEMKLLVVGDPQVTPDGVHLEEMTYVARITDADTFTHGCYAELHRRGVDGAQAVALISDGADWIQHLVEAYRPDAVRILDAMHACQRLSTISQALFPQDLVLAERWYRRMRDRLLAGQAADVLCRLQRWAARCPAIAGDVTYLGKRRALLQYAQFRAAGWPIGSGSAESAHRHLMQVRLKGAGMHWTIANANALLALRCLERNQRWEAEIPRLLERHRQAGLQRRRARQQTRRDAKTPPPVIVPLPEPTPAPTPPPRLPPAPYSWRQPFLPKKRATHVVNL
jgi:hypothetical protein